MHQPVAASGHLCAEREHARRWRVAKIQITVRIVLNHQRLVLHGKLQNFFSPLQAQHRATGIAKRRNQVHQLGAMLGNQGLELRGLHTMGIDWR